MDDLTPEKIQGHIQYVRDLLYEIPQEAQDDLEGEIDRLFLKQSMESFIREYADAGGWRNDPTLYIKIPLFATDHVLSQRDSTPEGIRSDLLTLLAQIPAFLNVASRNLHRPSEISRQVALNMAGMHLTSTTVIFEPISRRRSEGTRNS